MRFVIQRILSASVEIDEKPCAKAGRGLLVLAGFKEGDNDETISYMLNKLFALRIFEDENGKMNLSLKDIEGDAIIVPNFTLYGDARKGNRPGYSYGAAPETARKIFESVSKAASGLYPPERLSFGVFQADMKVSLINDGPVTILLDSDKNF